MTSRHTTPNPDREDKFLTAVTAEVAREAAEVADLLPILADVQWRRPPGSSDAKVRGGPPSDPTGSTALDPRRLRVRAELRTARKHLAQAAALMRGTRAALLRALDAWENPDN